METLNGMIMEACYETKVNKNKLNHVYYKTESGMIMSAVHVE